MIIRIDINNQHLPRLAKALSYGGEQTNFKAFLEDWIINLIKSNVKAAIIAEQAEVTNATDITDIKPTTS